MKKHLLLKSNLCVIIFILICFFTMVYTDASYYQKLTEEHVETVVQMADTDITRQLENSLNKEVAVAKSMANNTFLQDWITEEGKRNTDEAYLELLYHCLSTYQKAYDYTTVFCVSAESLNYYYQDGFNKTLHKNDEHDVWYYNFLDLNQEYDLQVDTDEVNGNIPTIFVNYRMTDENGKLLGVLGVGVELTEVQEVIDTYADSYGLSVYLVNRGGAKNSFSQEEKYFVNEDNILQKLDVEGFQLTTSEEKTAHWYNKAGIRECIVDSYMEFLKWNVIVKKDTMPLLHAFAVRLLQNILACIGIVLGCISVITFIFLQYDRNKKYMENIDELTGIPNRKLFLMQGNRMLKKRKQKAYSMFMFDIDNFKHYNDTKGHLYGNVILTIVGGELREMVASSELVARWGGDEFIGILEGTSEEVEKRFTQLRENLRVIEGGEKVTLSVGIVEIDDVKTLKEYVEQADRAMYQAKKTGKDTSVIL